MSKVTILDDLLRLGVRENCESPSLRLTKYLEIGDKTKAAEVNAVVACANKYVPQHVKETTLFTIPKQNGTDGVTIVATLKSRLIVNQASGILENAGLCLHRHFGYPYIPGSAVKGLARHAAWCEWKAEKDEGKKLEIAKRIADVFGYPTGDAKPKKNPSNRLYLDDYLKEIEPEIKDCSGSICFMAVEPVGKAPLVTDIVNCHHPKYYQGSKKEPTDTENPIPNFFPAVEQGAQFQFQMVPLRRCSDGNLDLAKKWLIDAITNHGIGAKTAAGYGWFEDVTKKYLEEEKRQQEIMQKHQEAKKAYEDRILAENLKRKQEKYVRDAETQRRASLSPCERVLEKWEKAPNLKAIVNGDDIRKFDKCSDEDKTGIVEALRQSDGIGAKVWAIVKGASPDDSKRKLYNANVDQQIRAYCKNTLKLGKMP